MVLWAAAITSVIGAAYTSVTFFNTFNPTITERGRAWSTVVFIAVSLLAYLSIGTAPAALLIFVGGFNGLILPIGLTIFIYAAWARPDLMPATAIPCG